MPRDTDTLPLATLIHVSDFHFGDQFTTDETFFKRLLVELPFVNGTCAHSYQVACALSLRVNMVMDDRRVKRIPVCVVFTGDLTSGGKPEEFLIGGTFLREAYSFGANMSVGLNVREADRRMEANISEISSVPVMKAHSERTLFIVPGNHDIWQRAHPDALGVYLDHFSAGFPKGLIIQTRSRPIVLYGLDSTQNQRWRHRLARGRVPPLHMDRLCSMLEAFKLYTQDDAIHIICLHHPLFPNENRWDPTLQLDDREAIAQRMLRAGADLVLSGHVHQAITEEGRCNAPNHAVASTATQQFSERGFFILDIYEREIELVAFKYDEHDREFVVDKAEEDIKSRCFPLQPGRKDRIDEQEKNRGELERLIESINRREGP